MKRKILIGLAIFSLLFLTSGFAVISTIESSTTALENLLLLHQVEIVREQLLIELKRTQLDLQLKDTRYARSADTIVTHVTEMNSLIAMCFECHHTAGVSARLEALQGSVEDYKDALSRVLTLRANARRLAVEQERAFRISSDIVAEVTNINDLTNRKLQVETAWALEKGKRMKAIMYIILAVTPLVALGLSVLFLRGFTRPVTALMQATRRLQGGDLAFRIQGLQNEYGEVADSFNKMAASLKVHCEHMQWAEQVVVLGELAAGFAHEIKNPLAGIKASMEVLAMDASISEENRDVLHKVSDQVKRMESLIRSFMNFARPPAPQFMTTDMHAILDSTIALAQRHPLYAQGRLARISIIKEYDRRAPALTVDPAQLQQVFLNLLLNAAEAMHEGGTVTVRTVFDPDARMLAVRVTDTGKGVDEAIQSKIFQPFFTTKLKGTGLGLSISKRLIEQHGGAIRMENSPGAGVSFVITLPTTEIAEVQVA